MGIGVHDLHVHVSLENEYAIEVDLEIGGEITLGEAHHLADEFEARALRYWPRATQIHTHLEPLTEALFFANGTQDTELIGKIKTLLSMHTSVEEILEVRAAVIDGRRRVVARVTMPSSMTLKDAHARVEEIKRMLYVQFPEIERLVVHVDPANHSH